MEKRISRKITVILAVLLVVFAIGGNGTASIVKASEQQVRNVIFMIPDGFSSAYATNYRLYKGKESIMDSMLVGMHRTNSANSAVTDSAAAGTAMATGVKTNNGMISMSPDGKKLRTILQASKSAGKSAGLVATSTITYATPAVFASHVTSRANEAEIAPQYLENDVDVLLGGGKKYFPDQLLNQAKEDGYRIVFERKGLTYARKSKKLLGLFSEEGMAAELDRKRTKEPSLVEMTEMALNILSQNKKGFFVMIEGSQIDWAGHANDPAWAMKDIEAFEQAVEKAVDFAKKDKHTLVVIAGDHDNGGMSVGGYGEYAAKIDLLRQVKATGNYMATQLNEDKSNIKEVVKKYTAIDLADEEVKKIKAASVPSMAINEVVSKRALVGWTTNQHTGVDIPVYAFGPGSELFKGLIDNTDLPKRMAKAMNIQLIQGK
ncbi:alkaline phosphatase [Bacillus sp. FJAT-50079]|uniref:alkaline phosphatase n=1 Tax=Bacillus sp. FJAT-50079 TaxID=2833577 RepID=UPI001BC97D61|nr:alkaline phosphatase [Bacillus sp. FJAT-50079]MBS4207889.1 alkaline phosphatase [Bacillus sp. FJAT-50079]